MSQSTEATAVTAGVLCRDERVLVCRRRPDVEHAGKWEFPGGKVEAGESLEACLRRELAEELGIDAGVGHLLWRTRHTYGGGKSVMLHFFFVREYAGEVRNQVFASVRWVPLGGLAGLDFLEGDREFVAALVRGDVPCEATQIAGVTAKRR